MTRPAVIPAPLRHSGEGRNPVNQTVAAGDTSAVLADIPFRRVKVLFGEFTGMSFQCRRE